MTRPTKISSSIIDLPSKSFLQLIVPPPCCLRLHLNISSAVVFERFSRSLDLPRRQSRFSQAMSILLTSPLSIASSLCCCAAFEASTPMSSSTTKLCFIRPALHCYLRCIIGLFELFHPISGLDLKFSSMIRPVKASFRPASTNLNPLSQHKSKADPLLVHRPVKGF